MPPTRQPQQPSPQAPQTAPPTTPPARQPVQPTPTPSETPPAKPQEAPPEERDSIWRRSYRQKDQGEHPPEDQADDPDEKNPAGRSNP